nr:uncharacterized protein LOC129271276 [Lytechinus pictus]
MSEPRRGHVTYYITISQCQDTWDDDCSCFINGSNTTSLECSASGFPHPPVITWDVGHLTYRLSSLNLTLFTENVTIVCKANDVNIKNAADTKTVCIYYSPELHPSEGNLVKTVPSPLNAPALLTCVILLLIVVIVMCIGAVYMYRKHSEVFRLPLPFNTTSKPKSLKNCDTATDRPPRGQTSEDSESYHGLGDSGNKVR